MTVSGRDIHTQDALPLGQGWGLCRGPVPQEMCHCTSLGSPALLPGLGHLIIPEDKPLPMPLLVTITPPTSPQNVSVCPHLLALGGGVRNGHGG